MGAVRVTYYAATQGDPRVAAVVTVSPVRLSYSYYLKSEDAEEFRANVEIAQRLVDEGEPNGVFRVNFPIPNTSAQHPTWTSTALSRSTT